MTAEQNYHLLREIEANLKFILMVCLQNPKLPDQAEARIKQLFGLAMKVARRTRSRFCGIGS
jgi:hypothetical protein